MPGDFQQQLQRVQALKRKTSAREEAELGRRFLQEKRWAQALKSLQRALQLDPSLNSAELDLIQVYRAMNLAELADEREQRRMLRAPSLVQGSLVQSAKPSPRSASPAPPRGPVQPDAKAQVAPPGGLLVR